nr:MliC family protein [uncultured Pseudomonas sp.]
MHKATIVIALLILVAGCAGRAAPDQWTHWVCDSGAEVFWRFAGDRDQVEVRLANDQAIHRLQQEPAGSGALYSDGRLSLHLRGEDGLVYWTADDDLIGRGCKAP